ncbi:FtsK/SpoIIIE domain-containing protein [Microbacterium sp. NC79]|uniref:FtsK/SpoIIIE domain-containing protein n=1 Tax=Microbacterium sp. NC79 TaxID=2851009 RepID=UPI001C2BE9BD|nr:FtsK/SpoIIIE domain-containing protein [Microbacterium sp. NC79]MBV0895296.1 hypothetical protein [Microbacterium sp. NC79]
MTYVLTSPQPTAQAPLTLPAPPEPRKRSAIPLAAAVVPILGGLGMYALTQSVIALMFAALGPVMLVATMLDAARGKRADARRYRKEIRRASADLTVHIDAQHEAERALRWHTHPDVARLTTHEEELWRVHPQREGTVVVGSGTMGVALDVARGVEGEEAQRLRAYAMTLERAPLVLPLDGGICVRADPLVAKAVLRALVLQVCCTHAPDRLRLVLGEDAEEWMTQLPHVRYSNAERVLAVAANDPPPSALSMGWCRQADALPAGCRTVIDVDADLRGTVSRDSLQHDVRAEAISAKQALAVAAVLAGKAEDTRGSEPVVHFADLVQHPGAAHRELPVVIGRSGSAQTTLDIVSDGPHAVVVGTTGSGKSELLVSWALALCAAYPPDQVTLLLADFKGGTAFDPLLALPHVTGVLTDLNGALARRAVLSLQAEIRRREQAIASVGARDITDERVILSRLVIIVDEFAAMLRQLPELDAVFTDIAARGRALGMHLILGAQRAAGTIRDATLANTPLRIALRVTDSTDARTIIGTDDAAQISGGGEGKGVAYVRRAADATPQRFRSALSTADDIARLSERYPAPVKEESWWDPLPPRVAVADLPTPARGIAVGVADDTENLRRVPVVIEPGVERGWWVLGGPRSGKTSLVELLVQSHHDTVRIPSDAELAWDCLDELAMLPATLVVWDDVDSALAAWPEPFSREASERVEQLVRAAGSRGQTWVLTAQRASGVLSRIADLLPGRVLLAVPSKLDHIAAGGSSTDHDPRKPPGRALMAGAEVQFAVCDPRQAEPHPDPAPIFHPRRGPIGVVARGMQQRVNALREAWGTGWNFVSVGDAAAITQEALDHTIFLGDPEQFQRAWATLELLRNTGTLVVAAECLADVRMLTGERATPPFARPGRWWVFRSGARPRRVRLHA